MVSFCSSSQQPSKPAKRLTLLEADNGFSLRRGAAVSGVITRLSGEQFSSLSLLQLSTGAALGQSRGGLRDSVYLGMEQGAAGPGQG